MRVGAPLTPTGSPSRAEVSSDAAAQAREFEALLWHEVVKALGKTAPGMQQGIGGQALGSIIDMQLSQELSRSGDLGIARTIQEQLGLGQAASGPTRARLLDGTWRKPISDAPTASGAQLFGAPRPGDRPESCLAGHCGIDLAESVGTPVSAAGAGTVRNIGRDPSSPAGLFIELDHGRGLVSRYLHLDAVAPGLTVGQALGAGAPLGTLGDTGTSSHGAHLHFELSENGQFIDPGEFLPTWKNPQGNQADQRPQVFGVEADELRVE